MWNGLLKQGLVDELHLMVGPAALGDGTPIFGMPADLALLETRRFKGSDNVLLRYSARRWSACVVPQHYPEPRSKRIPHDVLHEDLKDAGDHVQPKRHAAACLSSSGVMPARGSA